MDAEPGVDPHRVAEVIVTRCDGTGRRGSGYRVGTRVVLTAAHVVDDASAVDLRFDADTPDEWSVRAVDVVADPGSDIAAVLIDAPDVVPGSSFGLVGDGPDELAVQTVGFPRFKLKDYAAPSTGAYRDTHQAVGTVAPLSNRRSGGLEVTVRAPERDPDPQASPWEGMSGAAVWAGGRIIGVVTDHHPSDGLDRLAAARITALTDCPVAQRLRDLLGVPSSGLPDVTAPDRPLAPYLLQVRDIAPERLLGRDDELRELAGFAESYGWWEGPPWAGKTALMAWFALHPPPDVEVVPFFVGAGRAGSSDGDAFLGALTEQLTVLAGAPDRSPGTLEGPRGLLALLDAAARRCREAGRRLVLVVDGIDEDTGPAAREPSIAALLPRHPPADTTVLVTSRPGRPLPVDVPGDHPLHRCARRALAVSPHAREVERFARRELGERLRAGPLHEDLIGLITVSGGGLTRDDLAELTGASPFEVADLLSGAFGRSVAVRTRRPLAAPGYVLAHRTLREAAERELGPRLDRHRTRLHAWCEDHRRRGWPAGTPAYLLHDYPRLLAAADDAARLADLATDPARHERLLEVTGGDAAALGEIALAQLAGARRPNPDLVTAVLLAVRGEELAGRNRHVPVRLPAVWAALGRGEERVGALARGLPKRKRRAALAAAAIAAAGAGHLDDAKALAARVPDRDRRDAVVAGMAAAAVVHDPERAERWARRWCTPERRVGALARVAAALAGKDPQRARAIVAELVSSPQDAGSRPAVVAAAVAVGELGWAEALVAGTVRGGARNRVRAELAMALSAAGEVGRAEEVVAGIRRPAARLPVLAALVRDDVARGDEVATRRHLAALQEAARSAANPGDALGELVTLVATVSGHDPVVARMLLEEAEQLAANGIREDRRDWALARLAVAHAAAGDVARSEALLDQVADADRAAGALIEIAEHAARRGDARRAEAVVRRVPGASRRMHALAEIAGAFAAAGDRRRAAARAAEAEGMARRTTDPNRLVTMCARVVDGLVAIDALPAAVEVAEQIPDPSARAAALTRVAGALAAFGAIDDAVALANALDEPEHRSWALVGVCEAQAAAGRRDEAAATAAAVLADPSGDGYTRVVAFLRLSTALHTVGATGEAERLRSAATAQAVEDVVDPGQRARAIAHLCVALAAAGDPDGAAVLARRTEAELAGIPDSRRQDRARTRVVEVLAAAGRIAWAEDVARAIAGPAARVRALAALATAAAGEPDRAWTLLGRAEELLDDIPSPEDGWAATGRLAGAAAAVLAGDGGPADPRRNRIARLVVGLLGTDGWIEAVPALARLHWEAFDALVDWLATRTAAGLDEKLGMA